MAEIEQYAKTGPFGIAMWFALSEFKNRFLGMLLDLWEENLGLTTAATRLCDLLDSALDDAIQRLSTTDREDRRLRLLEFWPSKDGISDAEKETLARLRLKQLDAYLLDCERQSERVRRLLSDSKLQREIDLRVVLSDLVGMVIWPYYFVYSDAVKGEPKLITWMPPAEAMLWNGDPQLSDASETSRGQLGNYLYPSAVSCLEHTPRNAPLERSLAGHLENWLELGHSSLRSTGSERLDIGHVQPYSPITSESGFRYSENLATSADERSRFSDAFYLIDAALYVREPTRQSEPLSGHLIWCSPLRGFLPLLPTPRTMIPGGNQPLACTHVAELSHEAWVSTRGPSIVADAAARLSRTEERILPAIERQGRQAAYAIFNHGIGNLLRKGIPANANRIDTLRCLEIARWLANASTILDGGQSDNIPWSSGGAADEPIHVTLTSYIGTKKRPLCIDAPDDLGNVDPRFIALLFELLKNIDRHDHMAEGELRTLRIAREPSRSQLVSITYNGQGTLRDWQKLRNKLRLPAHSGTGAPLVREIVTQLRDDSGTGSGLVWAFSSDESSCPTAIYPSEKSWWRVELPERWLDPAREHNNKSILFSCTIQGIRVNATLGAQT